MKYSKFFQLIKTRKIKKLKKNLPTILASCIIQVVYYQYNIVRNTMKFLNISILIRFPKLFETRSKVRNQFSRNPDSHSTNYDLAECFLGDHSQ